MNGLNVPPVTDHWVEWVQSLVPEALIQLHRDCNYLSSFDQVGFCPEVRIIALEAMEIVTAELNRRAENGEPIL